MFFIQHIYKYIIRNFHHFSNSISTPLNMFLKLSTKNLFSKIFSPDDNLKSDSFNAKQTSY